MHAARTRYTSAAFRYNSCMAKKRIDRDKILQAFLTCAFEKSAGAVSLADIASLLGVNKASLYNHFSSRDEIYEAAIDFCAEYMSGVRFISERADSLVSLPFADALSKIVKQYFRSYEIDPLFQMYAFIHSSKFFSSKAALAAEQEAQKIADDTASLVARFAERGKLPSAESKLYQKLAPDTIDTKDMNDTAADTLKERFLFFAKAVRAVSSPFPPTIRRLQKSSTEPFRIGHADEAQTLRRLSCNLFIKSMIGRAEKVQKHGLLKRYGGSFERTFKRFRRAYASVLFDKYAERLRMQPRNFGKLGAAR